MARVMKQSPFTVAGLGNPGNRYEFNRHNVGFMFLDWLANQHGEIFSVNKHQGLSARLNIGSRTVHLLKPQTYMNKSGISVAGFINYFGMDPTDLLVVHDDIDLYPGRIKLVTGGGSGGHNGVRSIVKELGTPDFYRLKIGVGRPGDGDTHPEMDVDKYVLSDFSSHQQEQVQECFTDLEQGIAQLISGDSSRAQTFLNSIK